MRYLSKGINIKADVSKICFRIELAINRDLRAFLNETTYNSVEFINTRLSCYYGINYNIINRRLFT